jgi:hypothetical protein
VALLPYLEQDALFKRIDRKQGWEAPANRTAVATPLTMVRCASAPWAGGENASHSNYVGVAGDGVDAATLPLTDARCGFFGYSRTVKMPDVKDGTSSTLLLIETQRDPGAWAAGGPTTVRGIDSEDEPLIGKDRAFGLHAGTSRWNFGRVPVKATAAMGDGSVRIVPETVRAEVLAALATIAGGEEVALDW